MQFKKHLCITIAGICAGCVNGLFGAGGGMVLVPLLTYLTDLDDSLVFPASVCIILPVCFVSLSLTIQPGPDLWNTSFPYLIGSCLGGVLSGIFGKHIPTTYLHKILGILILWGGFRYLC